MDIGSAFLLGLLVGQWILLFAVSRAAIRLAELDTQKNNQDTDKPDRHTMIIDLDEERERTRAIRCSLTKFDHNEKKPRRKTSLKSWVGKLPAEEDLSRIWFDRRGA
jgi:hypothetical protein